MKKCVYHVPHGSIFDDDYRKKHITKQHQGKRILVKRVGAPYCRSYAK